MDLAGTVTSKGQITLPKPVRDALGLRTGDRVLFRVHQGKAVLAKVPDFLDLAGSVPVAPEKRGAPWRTVRAQAWGARATRRR